MVPQSMVKVVGNQLPTVIYNKKKFPLFFSLQTIEKKIQSFFVNRFNSECSPLNQCILEAREIIFSYTRSHGVSYKFGVE